MKKVSNIEVVGDALKFYLDTIDVSSRKLYNIIKTSRGYSGDEYDRWLANEIIKIAEKRGIGFSKLIVKWLNIISTISGIDGNGEFSDGFLSVLKSKIKGKVGTFNITIDGVDAISLNDMDWNGNLNSVWDPVFFNAMPAELGEAIKNDEEVTLIFNLCDALELERNSEVTESAKQWGISVKNAYAVMLYHISNFLDYQGSSLSNLNVIIILNASTLSSRENKDVVGKLASCYNISGFGMDAVNLYKNSVSDEEFAVLFCKEGNGSDSIELPVCKFENDELIKSKKKAAIYFSRKNMYNSLKEKYSKLMVDDVHALNEDIVIDGYSKGVSNALGYLNRKGSDICVTNYPIKDWEAIPITGDNIMEIILYYGVVRSLMEIGLSWNIEELSSYTDDYKSLVYNCIPIFLFDINSKFKNFGVVDGETLSNSFSRDSKLVARLYEKDSYFVYESKRLIEICDGFIEYMHKHDLVLDKFTFEEIRKDLDLDNLNNAYIEALSDAKNYIVGEYRRMTK